MMNLQKKLSHFSASQESFPEVGDRSYENAFVPHGFEHLSESALHL